MDTNASNKEPLLAAEPEIVIHQPPSYSWPLSKTDHEAAFILFHHYWVVLSSGRLCPEAKQYLHMSWAREFDLMIQRTKRNPADEELQESWKREMLQAITALLNQKYREAYSEFVDSFGPRCFQAIARCLCWEFEIEERDKDGLVEYCLHNFDPPHPVKLLGLDVGSVLATLIPLGGDGIIRARFQIVALANRLWRPKGPEYRKGDFCSHLVGHFRDAFTLYASAAVVKFLPILSSMWALLAIFHGFCDIFLGMRDTEWDWEDAVIHNPVLRIEWKLVLLLSLIAGVFTAVQYSRVMTPRLPMLTARLHRTSFEKHVLYETDFQRVAVPGISAPFQEVFLPS